VAEQLFRSAEDEDARRTLIEESFAVLDEAEAEHAPVARYALFSGGHDSLTACSVAFEWAAARGLPMRAAHIDTTIGIEQTRTFVKVTCAEQGWPLDVFRPPVPYSQIVIENGFPGPAGHVHMYRRLKERALRQLVREAKSEQKDRVMLVSGVRQEESVRRMAHVEKIQREGAQVWTAAIWNWSKRDCNREIQQRDLRRNEVVDLLHMSGECLCGAFAKPGEIKDLELWFPEVAEEIHALEAKVRAAGHHGCVWGHRPPRVHRDQMSFDAPGPMCVGCGGEQEAA
jgi:3'-phosphoadenosine 5'-phosphosulfate sulfotransferase (PAPS reductase)/FAD synthetase